MKKLVLVLFMLGLFSLSLTAVSADSHFRVVFILADSPSDGGWNFAHMRGINQLKELGSVANDKGTSFSVEVNATSLDVTVIENAGYNEADIESLARQAITTIQPNLIFFTWFNALNVAAKLAEEYPDILMEHGSGYPLVKSNGRNFSTYFIRQEQGDYIAGYVAGAEGYCNVGIVATIPIPEPVRGINGFALGQLRGLNEAGKDPSCASVQVIWINSWLDREAETQATQALLGQGLSAIRQMADTPYSSQTACQKANVVAFGYGSDVSTAAPCAQLTNEWNWGGYYVSEVEAALNGTWKSQDWWGGFAEGAIDLIWNPTVDQAIKSDAEAIVAQISADKFNPFCGPISGNGLNADGSVSEIAIPARMCLSDDSQLSEDWLANTVHGDLPPLIGDSRQPLQLVPATS